MKVLLLGSYPDREPGPTNAGRFHLALHFLEAALRTGPDAGDLWVETRVYHQPDLERLVCLEELLELRPHVVGLSCSVWNIETHLRVAAALRMLLPGLVVVLGGPQVSSVRYAERILATHPAVDVIVRGEGEGTLVELVGRVRRGEPLAGLPGASARGPAGVAHGPERAPLTPDAVPVVFAPNTRDRLAATVSHGHVSAQTYRGCRRRCRFCAYPAGGVRLLPLERVLGELDVILSLPGLRNLRIVDATIGSRRARAMAIFERLRHRPPGVTVQLFHDAALLDDAYLDAARDAGALVTPPCQEFGIETTNPAALRAVGRSNGRTFAAGVARFRTYVRRAGLPCDTRVHCIAGLPGDDYGGFLQSLRDALATGTDRIRAYDLYVLPGTELYEHAEDHGLRHAPDGMFQILETPTFSAGDLVRARRVVATLSLLDRFAPLTWRAVRASHGDPVTWAEALAQRLAERVHRLLEGSPGPVAFFEALAEALDAGGFCDDRGCARVAAVAAVERALGPADMSDVPAPVSVSCPPEPARWIVTGPSARCRAVRCAVDLQALREEDVLRDRDAAGAVDPGELVRVADRAVLRLDGPLAECLSTARAGAPLPAGALAAAARDPADGWRCVLALARFGALDVVG